MVQAVETDAGIPLEPGDVGTLIESNGDEHIILFHFDEEDPDGGTFDSVCIGTEAFVIIAFS